MRSGSDINQTAVRIHSANNSSPDTTATVHEHVGGNGGKIAWRAPLFDGKLYRGVMRANSAGGPACCEVETDPHTGVARLAKCPVVSWWSADRSHSCWAPVLLNPSQLLFVPWFLERDSNLI